MTKLNSKKRKKYMFYEEKSLVGLAPDEDYEKVDCWTEFPLPPPPDR
jgi:hypothetical protein